MCCMSSITAQSSERQELVPALGIDQHALSAFRIGPPRVLWPPASSTTRRLGCVAARPKPLLTSQLFGGTLHGKILKNSSNSPLVAERAAGSRGGSMHRSTDRIL